MMEAMQEEVSQLEQKRSQAIPIGARLDSAQARVTRAKKATEAATEAQRVAAEQLQTAKAEEKAAEDDYNALARQELQRAKEEDDGGEEETEGKALENLFLKLGQEKANLSEELQQAIEEAAGKAKAANTPEAKRRRKQRYARGDTVERSPSRASVSPTEPYHEPGAASAQPARVDANMIENVEDMDDAAFGKEVRARLQAARQNPY